MFIAEKFRSNVQRTAQILGEQKAAATLPGLSRINAIVR
jgi:hypothetical protein